MADSLGVSIGRAERSKHLVEVDFVAAGPAFSASKPAVVCPSECQSRKERKCDREKKKWCAKVFGEPGRESARSNRRRTGDVQRLRFAPIR